MKRIFVRGISRSGGTLMATILDAHPQIAMCYEIYQHLLAPPETDNNHAAKFLADLDGSTSRRKFSLISSAPTQIKDRNLRTFAARTIRSGLETDRLVQILQKHIEAGNDFSTFADRMNFIEQIALEKMKREGKDHWGVKTTSTYSDLNELYPDSAYFLYMMRDGRDVAASRKKIGSFNQPINHIAKNWHTQAQRFQQFAESNNVRARFVHYEKLTKSPEIELKELMDFLGIPWDDKLLSFHNQDLTIYRKETGHLSAAQVSKPINTQSVGRWKNDLTTEEISEFEKEAGDALEIFGYNRSTTCQAQL